MGGLALGKSTCTPPKFIRLPSGKLFDCSRKVVVHNITDLKYVCSRLNISEDEKFFILTEYNGETCLVPIYYPHDPNILHCRTSKVLIAYYLCEQFHLKCIHLDSPQDCADIKLVSDVVIANKNQLNTSEEDSKALEELLNSEELFTRLLSVLLSIPELTTQWVHVKDQKGKLYQIGINRDGLLIHQEFVESLSTHFKWQDLGNANANRSFVTLPVFMNAENAEKLIDFIDTKSSAKMKSPSKLTNVQNDRNNEEDKAITQQYLLKFRLADVKVAERLALQLYTICNRVIQNSTDHHNTTTSDDHNENNDENIFTRFNRQFRDTFKCFSSPFNVKSKMSKRKSCSTSLDPNATTTQHDANDADNHAEAKITTVQPSSLSDHTSQLSHNIVSSMSTVSMPIPTTSVTFVTSNDSYPVTVKSSLNDNDENIKKWSYSPVYSSIQTNTSTIMTTSTTHHHQPQQQQQSSNTSTTHTTFISNSKYHQSNIMKTNYEAIPTVVEPVEVAAGEAQAELNERDQQVLQSLLMNKSSTIVSSTPINNLSYTVTNTPMMTTSATSMNSMSSSPVSLSSFNNSSSVAKMNKSNTESFNINSANNTTITTAPPIIPTTTKSIQEDQLPKQSLNENLVSSSTSSSSSKLKTFPYSSSSQPTEISSEQKIANSSLANHSNHGDTSSIVEKPISNGENVHLQTTSEYVSSVSGSSVKPVIAHSVSVIPIKNHVASSVNINDNDNNRRISNSHSIDHNIKSTTIGHSITTVQYSSQLSDETVTLDMNNNNNNISNHTKPTVNGFKPVVVDDSAKITTTTTATTPSSPSSSMPTSDSFQSRIKPPSFTVKTSDLNKTSTPKITSVKADEYSNPNHVIQNNSHNNNTMPNTFNTPESIKMSNKINSAESDNNSLSTPPVLCSASVSVTGIRPPSGIKAPSITPPDKIKSKIATNGHTNASAINTSITSAHDEEMVHTNKKHIPTITEQQPPSCELIKRQESTTDDSLEQYPSGLPKPSSVYGKVQSTKSRPVLGNSPVANSGIPAPSIMPSSSSVSGQSHMPVPTSIPLPSGIKPPSRSPKSALAK